MLYPRTVGQFAQHSRSDPTHSKSQSEEQPRDQSHFTRHQILGIYQDGGKSRCQDHPDNDAQNSGPKKIAIGQEQGEGRHAEDREPDDIFSS